MSIQGKLRFEKDGHISFRCPGCNETHTVNSGWIYYGNPNKPTFSPSILVRSGCYSELHKPSDECWCTYYKEHPDEPKMFKCYRCHSFVRDGRIEFLGDCTHDLKGQTVDLPDFELEQK